MLQVVIDRAPLLLVGILRLATLPFREPVAADLVFPPPVAERVAGGVAELRYGVGRAAAEPGERLDGLHSLLCAVHPHGPPGPLLVQDFRRSPGLCFLLGGFSGYVSCAVSYERIHSGVIAPIPLPGKS